MKKLLLVVGARPNFMKIAPLVRAFAKRRGMISYKIVHTQQHNDYRMTDIFIKQLMIPQPHYFLGAAGKTGIAQMAHCMLRFERVCLQERPDYVVVVGDVNSTLAAAITAKRLGFKVAHIEAGLRSYDPDMPEEVNRVVTDSVTDVFFVTERSALRNLLSEGKERSAISLVGDLMIENLCYGLKKIDSMDKSAFASYAIRKRFLDYAVLTLHRFANVYKKDELWSWLRHMHALGRDIPIIFPAHPMTAKRIKEFRICVKNLIILKPLGYFDFLYLMQGARCIVTDSGGVLTEAAILRKPCFILRDRVEKKDVMTKSSCVIIGRDVQSLAERIRRAFETKARFVKKRNTTFDEQASERIARVFCQK